MAIWAAVPWARPHLPGGPAVRARDAGRSAVCWGRPKHSQKQRGIHGSWTEFAELAEGWEQD